MARNFVPGSSQTAYVATTGTYTTSLSFSTRFRVANSPTLGNQPFIFSLGNVGGSGTRLNLYFCYRNTSGTYRLAIGYTNGDASYNENIYDTTLSDDQWYTASGSVDWSTGTDTVALYLDGSSLTRTTTSGSTNVTPDSGSYRLTAGALSHAVSTAAYWDGDIAELAIWNGVLTAGEHVALATGAAPSFVRPSGFVAYQPFLAGVNCRVNGAGTNSGSTNTDHPPVIYQRSPVRLFPGSTTASLLPKLIKYGAFV